MAKLLNSLSENDKIKCSSNLFVNSFLSFPLSCEEINQLSICEGWVKSSPYVKIRLHSHVNQMRILFIICYFYWKKKRPHSAKSDSPLPDSVIIQRKRVSQIRDTTSSRDDWNSIQERLVMSVISHQNNHH